MQGNALPALVKLLNDEDPRVRNKGLLAVAALVRHNPAALDAFRQQGGVKQLVDLVGGEDARVARYEIKHPVHRQLEVISLVTTAYC